MTDAAPLLDVRLARAEEELTTATGGASPCSISETAGSVAAAKYREGRVAPILELRRIVGRGEPLESAVGRVAATWHTALADVTARDAGPDWLVYRADGVDELDERMTELGVG